MTCWRAWAPCLLACFLLVLGACQQADSVPETGGDSTPPEDPTPSDPLSPPVTGPLGTAVDGALLPEEPTPAPADPTYRSRRRMDLDQLKAAIEQVTGGQQWTDSSGQEQFEELSLTLGKPDYLDLTAWDLTPSLLFQKFLGDAARDVCTKLAAADVEAAEDDRILLVHVGPEDSSETAPEAVEANLRHLILRYHSAVVDEGSEQLNGWSWLFDSAVHVTGDPVKAWRTVCVGLITHPDFYSF